MAIQTLSEEKVIRAASTVAGRRLALLAIMDKPTRNVLQLRDTQRRRRLYDINVTTDASL
jgi:hypothetical protein